MIVVSEINSCSFNFLIAHKMDKGFIEDVQCEFYHFHHIEGLILLSRHLCKIRKGGSNAAQGVDLLDQGPGEFLYLFFDVRIPRVKLPFKTLDAQPHGSQRVLDFMRNIGGEAGNAPEVTGASRKTVLGALHRAR